jgi:DNA polymerase (family 10)
MKHPENNLKLSALFHSMADCYSYLGNEERFRAIAYENVARILYNMTEDIAAYATDIKTLDNIAGIGESIAEKIIEYLHTGKINSFEKLKKRVPFELLELLNITGIGPATLKTLHENLHINNRDELIDSIKKGKLVNIKGFGPAKIANISKTLKLKKDDQRRLLLKDAEKTGNAILLEIRKIPEIHKAELAGSLRRKKETIGDIDIVITADVKDRAKIIRKLIALPFVERVLAAGRTKASVLIRNKHVQVDIRIMHDHEYGAAMLYFTGSKEHNIKLRTIARERGYKINEYGIFDAQDNRVAGDTEEDMYRFLGLRYIPPEERLNKGEIEKARMR